MSAAGRVAHAAATIRARWERGVATDPQTEAAQALEDTGQLLDPEVAEELRHLRSAFAAQQSRAETLDGLARRLQDRVAELEAGYIAPSSSCTRCYGADAARFVAQGGVTASCPVCDPSEVEGLRARVAKLQQERHSTNDALAGHVQHADSEHCQADGEPWPCPTVRALRPSPGLASEESVQLLRDGIAAAQERDTVVVADVYPSALPWAKWLDEDDLPDFLDELAAAAIVNASSAEALAEVEATCARWRVIAEATRAHLTAPGPNCTCPEPVTGCTGVACGCPVCHRAVVPAADVPVPFALTEPIAVVATYAEKSAARLRGVLAPSDGGERS